MVISFCNRDMRKILNKESEIDKKKSLKNGSWNNEMENTYRVNRKAAISRTKDIKQTASYTDCALSSFIYGLINKESTHKTRNDLIDRYNDGHALTIPELRYLTYTSEKLNKFLDRETY